MKWILDNENYEFNKLSDAKWHCAIAYTPRERIKYLEGSYIIGIENDETKRVVSIKVDKKGRLHFGRSQNV